MSNDLGRCGKDVALNHLIILYLAVLKGFFLRDNESF